MTEQQTPQPDEDDERRDEAAGGPDAAELDEDPAYDPDDEGLKDIKGG